jgi:hypothetical protein
MDNSNLNYFECSRDGWYFGMLFGSILVLIFIVIGNMKFKRLHILILFELILTIPVSIITLWDGCITKISIIIGLNFLWIGYIMHNIIVILKLIPFFSIKWKNYIIFFILIYNTFWILHCVFLWLYFENINNIWIYTRMIEFVFKDILWIFCVTYVFVKIKKTFKMDFKILIKFSKINILLFMMILSVIAIIADILFYIFNIKSEKGYRNPFWILAFITKLFCDVILLDDFKTIFNKIKEIYIHNQ